MADPYAARGEEVAPAGERPAAASHLVALSEGQGGAAVADLGAAAALAPADGATCVTILIEDDGLLPPIARIDAPFAVALLALPTDDPATAERASAALGAASAPLLLLKQGTVAGPPGAEGAFTIEPGLSESLLAAAIGGRIAWERDPDFGYGVAAAVPGIEGRTADALCPRLLYAGADRVYEHAELVVTYKRLRHERLLAIGAAGELLGASGWPIEPTGQSWKD